MLELSHDQPYGPCQQGPSEDHCLKHLWRAVFTFIHCIGDISNWIGDISNWIDDIYNWFADIYNSFGDISN